MWSYFLAPDTSRAAAFCTRCSRSIKPSPTPRRLLMKAFTSVFVESDVKDRRIVRIWRSWKKQERHSEDTCSDIFSWLSRTTPRLTTLFENWIVEECNMSSSIPIFSSCWRVPIQITIVLSTFSRMQSAAPHPVFYFVYTVCKAIHSERSIWSRNTQVNLSVISVRVSC